MRIGIDSGGTFTDFVVLSDLGELTSFKLRSNPVNPATVILAGIARATDGNKVKKADVVHGSTVATNALLERKGARTALICTAGFEDVISIGRQNRPELYNLMPAPARPIVPRELCFGIAERVLFDGSIETPLGSIAELRAKLEGVESVAICLLHSYANDAHERALLEGLAGPGYVCASCDISPEFREFERASTTVINAYTGPLMDRYLGELERGSKYPVAVMQSNGGLLSAGEARKHTVRTILSGPAGGIVGAVEMARLCGFDRALTFDMGGTSTDVALAGQTPRLTTEARVDGYPVRVPMLDIHTVGAGGGSIAWIDSGGSLRVGPESCGAVPGPACYGVGERAAVTDAHVVLGRISTDQLAGGELKIDAARAIAAVEKVGAALGLDAVSTASAILQVANSNMERAIRSVSVERGEDPREFPLVAFGGCGGLHACELAAELGVATVIVPRLAGALSALGMLLADRTRDYSVAVLGKLGSFAHFYAKLEKQARRDIKGAKLERFADLRYAGQSYELTVPWNEANTADNFNREHQRIYGYSDPARPVQFVTLRLRATVAVTRPNLNSKRGRAVRSTERRVFVAGKWRKIPALDRDAIGAKPTPGPALVIDYGATTLVPPGWTMRTDAARNLILTLK